MRGGEDADRVAELARLIEDLQGIFAGHGHHQRWDPECWRQLAETARALATKSDAFAEWLG